MIPETTDTIASAIQSAYPYPSLWSMIIGPVIGGVLAVGSGILIAEWRWKKEQKVRRQWIASGLLADMQRSRALLEFIPDDTREHAQAVFAQMGSPLYLKHGLFFSHYAEIVHLGRMLSSQIVRLYETLEDIESAREYIGVRPGSATGIFAEEGPSSLFNQIVEAKDHMDTIISELEAIVADKPIE